MPKTWFPHQLVAQKISVLTKISPVEKRPNPKDRRRSGFFLTRTGKKQAKLLQSYIEEIFLINIDLYEEIEGELSTKLVWGVGRLSDCPIVRLSDCPIVRLSDCPIVQRLKEIGKYNLEKSVRVQLEISETG